MVSFCLTPTYNLWYEYCMAKKKRHEDIEKYIEETLNIWIDDSAHIPESLLQECPYVNTFTKELRYMSMYEYYMIGIGFFSGDPEHRSGDWQPVEDSEALRLLYRSKKGK